MSRRCFPVWGVLLSALLFAPYAQQPSPEPAIRLARINALERSLVFQGEGSVVATLHLLNGKFVALVHRGPIADGAIFRLPEDIQPGVYLLRIRQGEASSYDRITIF